MSQAIIGLENIGRFFSRSRWTIARWVREEGLPAARLPGGHWVTTESLLEAWILERRRQDPLLNNSAE